MNNAKFSEKTYLVLIEHKMQFLFFGSKSGFRCNLMLKNVFVTVTAQMHDFISQRGIRIFLSKVTIVSK